MDFKEYIKGKRHGKAANELEREALNDPFLQDAIDGFDSVAGDHLPVIDQLEKQFTGKRNHRNLWWMGIAASVVLIIGIGFLFSPEKETYLATEHTNQQINKPSKARDKSQSNNALANKTKDSIQTIASNLPKTNAKPTSRKPIEAHTNQLAMEEMAVNEMQSETDELIVAAPVQVDSNTQTKDQAPSIAAAPKTIYRINGIVKDEKGAPLIGATVKFENSMNGTVTDVNGKFEIPASRYKNDPLKVTYIGYNEKKLDITNDNISIEMEPNSLALSEVVVVGYGTQKKSTVTGAVSSIKSLDQHRTAGVAGTKYSFGKTEFKAYFEKNRKPNLCNNEPSKLKARFIINEFGRPADCIIFDCNCDEFKKEFMLILTQSPNWSIKNSIVELTLKIN